MSRVCLRAPLAVVFSLLLLPALWAAPAPSWVFHSIASPGDPNFTQLLGINNSGVIAGYFGDGTTVPNNGFTLASGVYTPENFTGATQTQVIGINNTGWTDGFYVDGAGVTHGFTYNGSYSTVDSPGTAFNQLLGINDGPTAVGYSSLDPTGATMQRSYVVTGVFTYIDGFLPPGTMNNQAVGLNNSGLVVGFYLDSMGVSHGYLYNGTSAATLNYPGSNSTAAFGINNNGWIVGVYSDAMGTQHGFVYNGTSWFTVDDPNAIPGGTTINGLNDLGDLVGFYTNANGQTVGFLATPVPEPGSLALLGTGVLAGFGVLRRRFGR